MDQIDPKVVILRCPDSGNTGWLRSATSRLRTVPAGVPVVDLPARPGREPLARVLAEHAPRRMIVSGTDADLAAVLVRLLRTDRLDVELGYLPVGRSAAAAVWGLPTGSGALRRALAGEASAVPLVRDDAGGVLVGRGELRGVHGESYCDEMLMLRGDAPWLVVTPAPAGVAVRAGRTGRSPDGRIHPVPPRAPAGRGCGVGRAVQIGCRPATVRRDGVEHPRPIQRWAWYRHTSDWLLVRG